MATLRTPAPARTRTPVPSRDRGVAMLLDVLDQAFDRQGWHGSTLAGAVRGLTPADAMWRPSPDRHNIWELVLHAAYWKYAVRRRLTGDRRGRFPRTPSDWPHVPKTPTPASWRADVTLLRAEHRQLREVVASLSRAKLEARGATKRWRNREMIHGVAAHDLYHAGQIQLIKRLRADA